MSNKPTYTAAQIEEMRAAVAAADAEQAEIERLERVEYMKPLVKLVASDEYAFVENALTEMAAHFDSSDYPSEAVRGLVEGNLPWLRQIAVMTIGKPVVTEAPVEPDAETKTDSEDSEG